MGGKKLYQASINELLWNIYWKDIDGKSNFAKIVTNVWAQLKLPKEDIEGIKLAGMGGSSKRDYLSFDCAMKEKGEVR